MVLVDDLGDLPHHVDILENVVADGRMLPDKANFRLVQSARLAQDLRGNGDLPEVMDEAGDPDRIDLVRRKIHLDGHRLGQIGDPPLMA